MTRRLPLVDALAVREPCPMEWEAMAGDGASRHCAACDRAVWDAASLTDGALAGLVVVHGGSLCLRITRDPRGRVVTRGRGPRAPGAVALLAASALALAPTLAGGQDAGAAGTTLPTAAAAPDRDHDAVPDAGDACPDLAGAPSPDPARHGCPHLDRIEVGQIRIFEAAYFQPRGAAPVARSQRVLRAVAEVLAATPGLRVRVTGHVSARSDGAAAGLGMRRANAVRDWLVARGVAAERLEVADAGAAAPLRDESTPAGRAQNRRVSFEVIEAPAR